MYIILVDDKPRFVFTEHSRAILYSGYVKDSKIKELIKVEEGPTVFVLAREDNNFPICVSGDKEYIEKMVSSTRGAKEGRCYMIEARPKEEGELRVPYPDLIEIPQNITDLS